MPRVLLPRPAVLACVLAIWSPAQAAAQQGNPPESQPQAPPQPSPPAPLQGPMPPAAPVQPGLRRVERSPLGTTLWLHLKNNPFPCQGFPWADPTTVVFVPAQFRASSHLEVLVHFHGHDGQAERKMAEHQLREQVSESGRNLLLAVVQGPLNAGDSSAGKLEQPGGFERFGAELLQQLRSAEVRRALGRQAPKATATWGRTGLSAHSGGYRAVAYVLDYGGRDIAEVYLFDALYGEVPRVRRWLTQGADSAAHILRSWYTGGAPQKLNQILVQRLAEDHRSSVIEAPEGSLTPKAFCAAKRVVIHTPVKHGEVPWRNNALRDALICSGFSKTRSAPAAELGPAHLPRRLTIRQP